MAAGIAVRLPSQGSRPAATSVAQTIPSSEQQDAWWFVCGVAMVDALSGLACPFSNRHQRQRPAFAMSDSHQTTLHPSAMFPGIIEQSKKLAR